MPDGGCTAGIAAGTTGQNGHQGQDGKNVMNALHTLFGYGSFRLGNIDDEITYLLQL